MQHRSYLPFLWAKKQEHAKGRILDPCRSTVIAPGIKFPSRLVKSGSRRYASRWKPICQRVGRTARGPDGSNPRMAIFESKRRLRRQKMLDSGNSRPFEY